MGSSFLGLTEGDPLNDSLLLIHSVKSNHQANVTSTLDRGADVNFALLEEPVNLRTPLRTACAQANVKLTRLLLENGADVFAHSEHDGWNALYSAAHGGHDHQVRLLLSEATEALHENTFHDGLCLLHLLMLGLSPRLQDSGSDILAWTLKQMPKLDVNPRSVRPGLIHWTPLHIACARGFTKAALVLLRFKAELNAATDDFHLQSPKLNKLASGAEDAVVCLKAGFAGVGSEWIDEGLLPIHLAAFGGHQRTVQMLVKQGQNINALTTRHCWTPLMFAVWSNNVSLVQEICRLGGRQTVNMMDRRGDGSEWTPLALAVVRSSPEMVQALIAYGADPLVRLTSPDFPGIAFIRHVMPVMADGHENKFTGPDSRISLLHLAVTRGCIQMLRTLMPLIRSAHCSPVRASYSRPGLAHNPTSEDTLDASQVNTGDLTAQSFKSSGRGKGKSRGAVNLALARTLESSRQMQERARERLLNSPVSEAQDCDPVAFCTLEGWSPAILAIVLHCVDPTRKVWSIELCKGFPDKLAAPGNRADIFVELLQTGSSLLEDRAEASPPVLPQRFQEVSQTLANHCINEFARLCKENDADRVAYRILHTTLCVATRFNRYQVVRHLLETGICDPRCRFLRPVECRPLHIAASCGYGHLAQLLLEYQADPLEGDENKEKPVFKLTRCYERQISELQARVAQLEKLVGVGGQSSIMSSSSIKGPGSPSYGGRATGSATPVLTSRIDSQLHDSRL
eukprot:TRINITY_DN22556_c0_g1_i1.p1 TRINITY_DN22556_c0_g1~~TRINITY_DN22556_c0_g1_i1.p1  ORF type:complete len:740 (+),score=105.59 TRINITY_DN22556_c0_g1_i1:120-2339(+)